jgi:hypothetical protein
VPASRLPIITVLAPSARACQRKVIHKEEQIWLGIGLKNRLTVHTLSKHKNFARCTDLGWKKTILINFTWEKKFATRKNIKCNLARTKKGVNCDGWEIFMLQVHSQRKQGATSLLGARLPSWCGPQTVCLRQRWPARQTVGHTLPPRVREKYKKPSTAICRIEGDHSKNRVWNKTQHKKYPVLKLNLWRQNYEDGGGGWRWYR